MIKDGHISPSQLMALMTIIIIGKGFDSSVLILIHWGHSAAELLLIISEGLMIALIALLLPLMHDQQKNLVDLFYETLGPIIGSLCCLILFISLLLDFSMNVRYDLDQIRVAFLPTTPPMVILLITIIAVVIPVYYGIEVLARFNLLMFTVFMFMLLTLIFVSFKLTHTSYLPPVLGPGLPTLMKDGVQHTGYFGEYLVFLMLRPYVRSYISYRRTFYLTSSLSIALGVIALLINQMIFPYPNNDMLFFPFLEMVKLIYFGRFIQHIEAIYAVTWLVVTFARLSLLMYILSLMAGSIARAHNYRRFAPSIGAMVFYIAILPATLSDAIDFKDIVLEKRGILLYGGIPILFLIVAYWKKWRGRYHAHKPPTSGQKKSKKETNPQPQT